MRITTDHLKPENVMFVRHDYKEFALVFKFDDARELSGSEIRVNHELPKMLFERCVILTALALKWKVQDVRDYILQSVHSRGRR